MPALQTVFNKLNREFNDDKIGVLANMASAFAPGKPLDIGFMVPKNSALYRAWKAYMDQVPGVFHETVRAIMDYALNTTPPTQVTFAWAPSYDHELTVWQAPDTATTRGGITILVKGRYPIDSHPLAKPRSAAAKSKSKPRSKR